MKLWIYRLFVAPTMTIAVFLIAPFHSKIRAVLKSKMKHRTPFEPEFPPVWIHASSGEFEYAKSVIRELKAAEPRTPVVVTYSSATYINTIENTPGVDISFPLPLDLPGPWHSFLRKVKPKYLLIARTDLWPEMLHQARAFHIPVVLFAYTQKAPREMGWGARKLRSWLLGYVSQIQCVTKQDADNVKELGVRKPVVVMGDPRFDQVQYRLQHPKTIPAQLRPARAALVAGSTWPQDEAVLLEALPELLKAKKLQLILVPHEPTPAHLKALENKLTKAGLTFKRFTSGEDWSGQDVLLVDQVGVLAELYQWANMAFVGGSYKSTVHSVMEPLGAGCVTLVGPHYRNNREALEFVNVPAGPFTAVQVCSDALSLGRTVELLLGPSGVLGPHEERRKQILAAFQQRLGAGRKTFESLSSAGSSSVSGDRGLSIQN